MNIKHICFENSNNAVCITEIDNVTLASEDLYMSNKGDLVWEARSHEAKLQGPNISPHKDWDHQYFLKD